MKSTFAEIKFLVGEMAAKIKAPADLLPTYGYSRDLGFPHIEVGQDGTVSYVAIERGRETYRYNPPSMDDLLYEIFNGVAWSMAGQYELKHRIKGQDFRRIMFDEHERILGVLNKDWQSRLCQYHKEILSRHPFDDHSSERVGYLVLLQSNGETYDEARRPACEKYPLPH